MGTIQTLEDLLSMLRRRAPLLLAVIALGTLASVVYALQQAHSYESSSVIQIERPTVVDSSVDESQSAARRLQLIEQRLMVRDNLLSMIEEYGLYADLSGLTQSEKVELLRQSTRIESIAAARQGGGSDGSVSALIITARQETPDLAAAIANDFATAVLDMGSRTRSARTEATLEFFAAEESRLETEIAELEAEIARFKAENDSLLPDSLSVRREELMRLGELALEMDSEIAALRRERQALEQEPARALSQRRMSQIDAEVAELTASREMLAGRVETLEATIQQTPEIERRLSAFERQLGQLQDQYRVTTQRRADAEIGQRLETDQRAERFEVLEWAIPADYPLGPSRRNVAAAGAVASVGLALGLAFVLEFLNPVIRSAGQMQRQLDLRPVVAIPYVMTPWERRRQHMLRLGALIVLAAAVMLAAGLALGAA